MGWSRADVIEFLRSSAGTVLLSLISLLAATVSASVSFRVGYRVLAVVAGPVRRVKAMSVPKGPAGILVVSSLFAVIVVLGATAPMPNAVGTFGGGDTGEATATASGVLTTAFDDGDAIRVSDGTANAAPAGYQRPQPDTAGDRLKDGWVRDGETPDGAPLPNGSVGRLDLYVSVVHGRNVEPLTDREEQQLRRVWASMPVENPDGSTGIAIHLVDGDELDESIQFGEGSDHTEYYTEDVMGPRRCRYHLVVLGEPTSKTVGWAAAPGYSSFVTGVVDPDYGGAVTNRVRVMTHELLHNVVGRIDGTELPDKGLHTPDGWLGGDEYMSQATSDQLNETRFRGSTMYQRDICGHDRSDE